MRQRHQRRLGREHYRGRSADGVGEDSFSAGQVFPMPFSLSTHEFMELLVLCTNPSAQAEQLCGVAICRSNYKFLTLHLKVL